MLIGSLLIVCFWNPVSSHTSGAVFGSLKGRMIIRGFWATSELFEFFVARINGLAAERELVTLVIIVFVFMILYVCTNYFSMKHSKQITIEKSFFQNHGARAHFPHNHGPPVAYPHQNCHQKRHSRFFFSQPKNKGRPWQIIP